MEKGDAYASAAHVEDAANVDEKRLGADLGESSMEEEPDDSYKMTFGKFMAILSFVLGYFSDTAVITMLSTVLQVINKDIGPSSSYSWIVTSVTVAGAAIAPIVGRFSDVYGRRNFLLAGNILAVIGTIVGATAKTVNSAIVAGVFIGIATSMRQLAWACLGEIVPKHSRGVAFALLQICLSIPNGFAPVIAYAFVQNGSWRPVYWWPFAMDATAFLLVFFFYHPMNQYIREENHTRWDQFKDSDFIGSFLYIGGVVSLLLGISWGGQAHPWKSAATIAPIVVGFAGLIACGFFEVYSHQKYAIFPPVLFRNVRGFTVLLIATFILGMLYYSILVLWPTQVAALYAETNYKIGWYSAAGGLGGFATGLLWGPLQKKFGRSRWQLLLYTAAMTICCGCLATSSPTSNVSSTALVALTFSFVSATSVFATSMLQVGVKHEHIGIASGLIVTCRTLGGCVATTIYLTVLQNKLTDGLTKDVAVPLATAGVDPSKIPAILGALTTGDTSSLALASLNPGTLILAVHGLKVAYANAFRLIYLISIAFGVFGTIVVAFAANVDHLMTKDVEITLAEGAHVKVQTDTGAGHIIKEGAE